jgi:hypothetical protein
MSPLPRPRALAGLRILAGVLLGAGAVTVVLLAQASEPSSAPKDAAKSEAAFIQLATVLRSPRCMNCHTVTDFPRQGNERRRHDMLVMRGPSNHGVAAMQCSSCHQDINQENGVPGAPNWSLAPLSMAWENLSDHELADELKDTAKNGQRSLEKLYHHMADDELVGWAWHPGANREPPPMSREAFAKLVREWIDNGAVSPPAK